MLLFSVYWYHVMRCVHHSSLPQPSNIIQRIKSGWQTPRKLFCFALFKFIYCYLRFKYMPGRNCAFFGCPTSQKHGLSLFKIPAVRDDDSEYTVALKTKARDEWLRLLTRTRETTPELKKRIEAGNIYICELHFKSECILTNPKRKVLVTGSVPTENLPKRSHEVEKKERRTLLRHPPMAEDFLSTSALSLTDFTEDALQHLEEESIAPWKCEKMEDGDTKFKLRI